MFGWFKARRAAKHAAEMEQLARKGKASSGHLSQGGRDAAFRNRPKSKPKR